MFNENDIMDVDALCAYLKTSRTTIYKLAQTGLIPARKVGRLWRFNRAEINEWLRSHSAANAFAVATSSGSADKAKDEVCAWNDTLSQTGFTEVQIATLRAFSLDTPSALLKSSATKAGREGLCKALKVSEDQLDALVSALIATTSAAL